MQAPAGRSPRRSLANNQNSRDQRPRCSRIFTSRSKINPPFLDRTNLHLYIDLRGNNLMWRVLRQFHRGAQVEGDQLLGAEEASSDAILGQGATRFTATDDISMVDRQTYADDQERTAYQENIDEVDSGQLHENERGQENQYEEFGGAGGELEMDEHAAGGLQGSESLGDEAHSHHIAGEGITGESRGERFHDGFSADSNENIEHAGRKRSDGIDHGRNIRYPQNSKKEHQLALHGQAQHAHRHDLPERSNYATHLVAILIWVLVIIHLLAVLVWLRAWWKQKRSSKKDPTMRSLIPAPPQKVTCSYDMDKTFSMPKIELANLPIKALSLKKSKA